MADNQARKPQAQEKKEEKPKQPSTLESVVNESSSAINGLLGSGVLAASAFLPIGGPILNFYGAPINVGSASVVASQPLSALMKGKVTSKELRNDAIYGLLQLPAFDFVTKTALNLSKNYSGLVDILGYSVPAATLAGTAAIAASAPLLTAAYYPVRYLMGKGSFEGFGKSFKDNYLEYTTRTALTWGLTTAACVYGFGMAPLLAAGVGNLVYRFWSGYADQKKEVKKPFIKYTLNSFYNLGSNLLSPVTGSVSLFVKGLSYSASTTYNIGSAIGSLFKTAPKPAAAPHPA